MKKVIYFLIAVFVITMSSCTKQEVVNIKDSNILTIHLSSKSITRAALANNPKQQENNVNTLTVGVFKSDGSVKVIKDFSSITNNTVTMKVLNLSTSDKVICVINTPANTFTSASNVQSFNNIEITLDKALTTNGVDIITNNLIMYGEGIIKGSNDNFTSDVDVYHLNSKVTFNGITTQINGNGTFITKEVYLSNVPSSFKFSYNNPYKADSYLFGGLNSQISGESQKLYLGSGNINNNANKYFFYASPNNSNKYTKLVIYGYFDADGNGPLQGKNTYYPIIIDKNLLPNKNYILNVTLKGIGVDSPEEELDYANLKVNVNINGFSDTEKDITLE